MSERLYKDNFHKINTKRAGIVSEMSGIEAELASKPVIQLFHWDNWLASQLSQWNNWLAAC